MAILKKSPFKCNMIEYDPMSYGVRLEQISESIECLYNNMSILISGPRGIGKSSLGAQLQNVLEGDKRLLDRCKIDVEMPNSICIFIACSKEDSLDKIVMDIISLIENKIDLMKTKGSLKQASFELNLGFFKSKIDIEIEKNKLTPSTTASILVESLEKTIMYLNNVGINIMMDELDELNENINFGHFIKIVHETLFRRNIMNVSFIFAGQIGVYSRMIKEQPAFERIVKHIQLDALDYDTSTYIIESAQNNSELRFKIEEPALKMILSIASGYPYTLHLIGHEAFYDMLGGYINTPALATLRKTNVLGAIDKILTNKKERFFYLIDLLSNEEKIFIYMIANKPSKKIPIPYELEELFGFFCEINAINKLTINFEVFLSNIENKRILKKIIIGKNNERYIFCEELFRIFIASGLIQKNEEIKLKTIEQIKTQIDQIAVSSYENYSYTYIDRRFL